MNGKVSVVICSYNRAESLRDTLHAVTNQTIDSSISVEILAVDNNSSDHTKDIVRQAEASSSVPIRYIFEPKQGISYARNRGLAESKADYILFTDDDVIPSPHWIQSVCDAFETYKADVVGGKILPLYQGELPAWAQNKNVLRVLWGIWALLDLGDKTFVIEKLDGNYFYGANFSFRKSCFDEFGGFRTDLGLIGNKRLLGEDSEMVERLFKAGKKLVYAANAGVEHKVPVDRIKMKYVRYWRYKKGYTTSQQKLNGRKMMWPEFWLLQECFKNAVAVAGKRLSGKSDSAIDHELQLWTQLGLIAGCFDLSQANKESHAG